MGVSPLYSIHQYSEEIYKVVAFKGVRDPENPRIRDRENEQHYDAKLNEVFCRVKSLILQYALCNPWGSSLALWIKPNLIVTIWTSISRSSLSSSGTSAKPTARRCSIS